MWNPKKKITFVLSLAQTWIMAGQRKENRTLRIILLTVPVLLVFTACLQAQHRFSGSIRYFNDFENQPSAQGWINLFTVTADSDSVNHYSRCDAAYPYSAGIEGPLPAALKARNCMLTITSRIYTRQFPANIQCVISGGKEDSLLFWKGFSMPDSLIRNGEWVTFEAGMLIPASMPAETPLKIFYWNAGGNSAFYVDDMDIRFTEVQFPSFLPQ